MPEWKIHWLEAEGVLEDFKPGITTAIRLAQNVVDTHTPHRSLDILVQPRVGEVIPEIGMLGVAHRKSLFSLSLDPSNPNFLHCLADGTLSRQVAHEAHHCYRMAGPGYGLTLGEALVSEGLAGQFVSRLFDSAPEPWERALSQAELKRYLPSAAQLQSSDYDHASWFFGSTSRYPRWLGYTLGYQLAGHWIDTECPSQPGRWIDVHAMDVLTTGLASLHRPTV
ncbi:MAG: hypothetical protein GAK43_02173 [Stenotrophomonas maltophilia]|nr:MAG: hypothetical protein GAK43_02173 [Stenotrophomonas maltophilia]